MPPIKASDDAFGAALMAHLDDRECVDLTLELDDGWSTPAMPAAWFFQGPEDWVAWERDALSAIRGPVLDLGAGAGRASLFLQERGLDVLAVDTSPGAIDVCLRRGVRRTLLLDFLDEVPTSEAWAAILLLCGNLGLAGGWEESRRLLKSLAVSCRPDAILLADTVDPRVDADEHALQYQAKKLEAGGYVGDVTLRLVSATAATPWWKQTNFIASDIPQLIQGTGWELVDHHVPGIDHYVHLRRV